VAVADLTPLRRVEELLSAARQRAAELDEEGALRRLAEAQRLAWDSLAVPGAAAFCAEVELQLAVTAAQAGRWELAADSLARAARLDGQRRLLAGEASPEVVALGARVFRDAATGAEGELPIGVSAPGARIFVDDIDRGLAPQRIRIRVGTHALRVEAPGHVAHYARLEVSEGARPAQHIVLAPDPRLLAVERVAHMLGGDLNAWQDAVRSLLLAAPDVRAVAWFEDDSSGRRLLYTCHVSGCRLPLRVEANGRARRVRPDALGAAGLTPDTLAESRRWLHVTNDAQVAAREPERWWNRWYVWSALSALAVSGGVLAAIASRPEPTRSLRVVVDAGDLR